MMSVSNSIKPLLCHLVKPFFPWEQRQLNQQSPNWEEQQVHFMSGILVVLVRRTTLNFNCKYSSYERNGTVYWSLVQKLYCIPWVNTSNFQSAASQHMPCLSLQQASQLTCQVSCFQIMEYVSTPVNSMAMSPLLGFFCCEMSSLVRNDGL